MVPGYSGIDSRVAELRYRLKLVETQLRRFVTNPCPAAAGFRSMFPSLRHRLGTILARAGQRLQGVQAITRESLAPTSKGEVGVIA